MGYIIGLLGAASDIKLEILSFTRYSPSLISFDIYANSVMLQFDLGKSGNSKRYGEMRVYPRPILDQQREGQ